MQTLKSLCKCIKVWRRQINNHIVHWRLLTSWFFKKLFKYWIQSLAFYVKINKLGPEIYMEIQTLGNFMPL